MKNLILILSLVLSVPVLAQHHSNCHNKRARFGCNCNSQGGYGALMAKVGEFQDGEQAVFVGARGAWVLARGFSAGLGAYSLVNSVDYSNVFPNETNRLEMYYGGIFLEPVIGSRFPVHLAFPTLLGAGWTAYRDADYSIERLFDGEPRDSDVFFVIEPGASLEFNITHFFRLSLDLQYRWVQDLDLINTNEDLLEGWSTGISLKFGDF